MNWFWKRWERIKLWYVGVGMLVCIGICVYRLSAGEGVIWLFPVIGAVLVFLLVFWEYKHG